MHFPPSTRALMATKLTNQLIHKRKPRFTWGGHPKTILQNVGCHFLQATAKTYIMVWDIWLGHIV